MKNTKKSSGRKPEPSASSVVGTTTDGEKLIAITFPERHWVVILGAIHALNTISMKQIGELRDKGLTDVTLLPKPLQTVLGGPMMIQGVIVKELAAHGVMAPEANDRVGIDHVMEWAAKVQADREKGEPG